jgi:hypothetical protein
VTDAKGTELLSFERYDKEQNCIAVRPTIVCVFGKKYDYT